MKKGILIVALLTIVVMSIKTVVAFGDESKSFKKEFENENYKPCIEACQATIIACTRCIEHCSISKDERMSECIRLCKECRESCDKTILLMSSNNKNVKDGWMDTMKKSKACAEECEKYESSECKECAKACRKTVKECEKLLVE